jgi:hypothetical protein
MEKQPLNCPNLAKLFGRINPYVGTDAIIPLPAPTQGSSLAVDADALQGKWIITPVVNSFSAGIQQVYVLRRLIAELEFVDTVSPYALLRSALENFAHMAWLLNGHTQAERRIRALQTWAHDMKERNKHENEVGHTPKPPAERGSERRDEVIQLAQSIGLPKKRVEAGLTIIETIQEAAKGAGYTPNEPVAAWRMASGFVHGRLWPNLRASDPTGALPMDGGFMMRFVISDEKLDEVALWCDRFMAHALDKYRLAANV